MVISYGVRGASSKPIAGTGLPSKQPKFATSISEPVRFIASAATSELRRPMGEEPIDRRDRAGRGGFTNNPFAASFDSPRLTCGKSVLVPFVAFDIVL